MPKRTFVILGPDDGDGIPCHWDREFWQWMEGAAGDSPSPSCVFTEEEIFAFPPSELPTGAGCIVDISTGKQWMPCMGGVGPLD
jgi:hypothetical protein